MTNVILCGGNGTRLWPISRTLMPKQFIKLFDERSLFQMTVKRNAPLCDKCMVVSNTEQYFLASDQLEEIEELNRATFILEPIARNTAPALALAAFSLDPKEIMLVTPSDHLIESNEEYTRALHRAKELAQEGYLVTFGITPAYPETGFGYIEADGEKVIAFHEKPNLETAKMYLERGDCYWNSGMFCFEAKTYLDELKSKAPQIYENAKKAYENAHKSEIIRVKHEDMARIEEESIDYAVIEKSSKVCVVPSNFTWSDLGSFDALYEALPKDENGNTKNENLIAIESKNNFVYTTERMIALVDIDELIVVDTADALLITKKGSSQKIKDIVKKLKGRDSNLPHIHVTAHRPWGTYTVLEDSDRYKIKRIVVKPGKRLSLQKHFHRSEHWIVVSGTALVRVGDEEKMVKANESVYIPMGEKHRLENPGKIPLVLVEAQVGEYTGEDDIVRMEDDFKRV